VAEQFGRFQVELGHSVRRGPELRHDRGRLRPVHQVVSSRAETTGRCPTDAEIAARYVKIRPYLDERQRRLWLVARATWTDVKTVRRGRDEVEAGLEPDGRVRGPGGGRPSVAGLDAGMLNGGTEWAPAGQPERVSVHGFPDEELGTVTRTGSTT
jgi:hypothetical protein